MYVFYDSTGKIIGGVAADSPDVVLTRIPDGCTELYLDDTKYSDVWTNMGEYTIQNGQPVHTPIPDATKLQNYQSAKISQLRQSLESDIATFQSNALGSTHTYLNDDSSRTLLASEYAFVRSSDYDNSDVQWYTKEEGRVTHNGSQIVQVFLDGRKWTSDRYSHYDDLVKQVQAVTLANQTLAQAQSQIDAIVW